MPPSVKKANTATTARQILLSDASSAIAVMVAAKEIFGDHHSWEPESVWMSLVAKGIDLSESNRCKLMAAVALVYVPSFYWDGIVFEKTAIAFDSRPPNPDALEEAMSAQLAWAVEEASWIVALNQGEKQDFQHEPAAYAAVIMHREGMVLAPQQLSFAQELLDGMNRDAKDLKERVKAAWEGLDKATLASRTYAETPEDVQLARLAAIELHVRERDEAAGTEVASLRA